MTTAKQLIETVINEDESAAEVARLLPQQSFFRKRRWKVMKVSGDAIYMKGRGGTAAAAIGAGIELLMHSSRDSEHVVTLRFYDVATAAKDIDDELSYYFK